jgi:hypothetical protein
MTPRPAAALIAACAVLFGASFAAAKATDDDPKAPERTPAASTPAPAPQPSGHPIAFGSGGASLPGLKKRPKPKEPASPPAVYVAPRGPARSAPAAPAKPDSSAPEETPRDSAPVNPEPQPSPPQNNPPATDFYDEG